MVSGVSRDGLNALRDLIPGLRSALTEGPVIDLAVPGSRLPDEDDGIDTTIAVRIDPDGHGHELEAMPGNRRYILMRNMLQQLNDYRSVLRAAFGKLAIGGWMVITVPHQFLSERRFRLPSRYDSVALRFHTPASLLAEIEEALDPTEYRIRLLIDDDTGFDYEAPLDDVPLGHKRIVLALERLKRPHWANGMVDDKPRVLAEHVAPADIGPTITHVISPRPGDIKTILVIKLDHRGDFLLADPVFRELKSLFVGSRLTLICGSWNRASAQSTGLFDEVIAFDFFGEDRSADQEPQRGPLHSAFAAIVKGRHFDLAIDLRGFSDTRPLLRSVDARYTAGVDNWNAFPWLDIRLDLPSATTEGRIEAGFFEARKFQSKGGKREVYGIEWRNAFRLKSEDLIIWGPYAHLDAGEYEFLFLLQSFGQDQRISFDISCDAGQNIVFAGTLSIGGSSYPKLSLNLPQPLHGVEFRFYARFGLVNLRFSGVRFRRSGQVTGLHQREIMHLLVQLTASRLAFPFKDEAFAE